MASLYNVEPQPTAKVILNTTAGDLTLEIFAKQAPLASRNFLQHCLDGYYINTIFHRLVPNFIIQGGDPTGTGSGGISSINDGDPFQDEFHTRLKYNRRGLLGMANEGRDSNASQFFLTLGPTPELQGKNTMFGRIEGDTIFNLVKMGDAELADDSERPLYPTKIIGSEIILNPFSDMQARVKAAPRTTGEDRNALKKRKKPAGKSGLSFGLDEEDEQISVPIVKKLKVNPKMAAAPVDQASVVDLVNENTGTEVQPKPDKKAPVTHTVRQMARPASTVATSVAMDDDPDGSDEDVRETRQRQAKLDKTNAEIAALKLSMRRNNDAVEPVKEKPKNALEAMIPSTSIRGRKRGKAQDEQSSLKLFNAFKSRLSTLPAVSADTRQDKQMFDQSQQAADGDDANGDDEAELCDLHFIANCQSCKSWDEQKPDQEAEAEQEEADWMSHQLTFARDTLGKDLEWKRKMEEIEVIDPREKARVIKEKSRKSKVK